MYLHYPITIEQTRYRLGRLRTNHQQAERMYEMLRSQAAHLTDVPYKLQRQIRAQYQICVDCTNEEDVLNEILWWDEDREGLIEYYEKQGFTIVYRANNKEFATHDDALGEAIFVHRMNNILFEYGADGDWEDDLAEPESMVQAVFVKE